jgi:hypothetical protein
MNVNICKFKKNSLGDQVISKWNAECDKITNVWNDLSEMSKGKRC